MSSLKECLDNIGDCFNEFSEAIDKMFEEADSDEEA